MFEDTIPFEAVSAEVSPVGIRPRAIRSFVRFVEARLGARFVYNRNQIPFGEPKLLDLFAIAEKLKKQNTIKGYYRQRGLPDEPQFYAWSAHIVSTTDNKSFASGANVSDDRLALTATLAEAAERHVWAERVDYLDSPTVATVAEIAARGNMLAPGRFAGFSNEQRAAAKHLQLSPETKYLWVRGHSWVSNAAVWLLAQVVSGSRTLSRERRERREPLILANSTNGLATAPSQEGAVLAGALELIERDAYMIMWLNQLSPPQFDMDELCRHRSSLKDLVEQCRRYRLRVSAVRMLTDAPAYAVCAVVEDMTSNKPKIIIGLRADKNPAYAVEKALMEALRIRQVARSMLKNPPPNWDSGKRTSDVGHMDRLLYWMVEGKSDKLAFLTEGPVQNFAEPWENDTDAEHMARITRWCRERSYECASVSLTRSNGNPTPWHIEMVVMPELQPIHLHEHARHLGGKRLGEIPELFGYTARTEPYIDDPHPFA